MDFKTIIATELFKKVLEVVQRPDVPVHGTRDEEIVAARVAEKLAPVIQNQTNQEPLWKSRIMRGSLLALLGLAGGYLGINLSDGDVEGGIKAITDLVSALGVLYAIYGRVTSKGTPKL